MVRASLSLTIPGRIWISTISQRYPNATFRVRSARSCDGIGIGLVELEADDAREIIETIERQENVHAVQPLQRGEDRVLIQIEADTPVLLNVLEKTGVPVEMPFEIRDGEVDWTLTTTRERLSTLSSELEHSDLSYIVEHIWDSAQLDHVLTARQQEVVDYAIESGYYDSPRQCTQEELAERLDMAKSTCSEILHRAEERIVKRFETDAAAGYTQTKQRA
jgi:predicted DNA binding protein